MALTSLDKDNVNRLMESLAMVELDESKKRDVFKYSAVNYGKLEMLREQIEILKNSARDLIEDTFRNKTLHEAKCNFCKVTGSTYHFYEKEDGTMYCSIISPKEWSTYYKFVGSYLYDFDHNFKLIE